MNNKIQQQQFDFIPPFNENDIDIKESKTTLLNDYSYNKLDVFIKVLIIILMRTLTKQHLFMQHRGYLW